MLLIDTTFVIGRFSRFFVDTALHCRQFEGNLVNVGKWWELGQNYKAKMLALVVMAQLLIHAAVMNTGLEFRRSWWRNWMFLKLLGGSLTALFSVTLLDSNWFGCLYGVHCRTDRALAKLGYEPIGVKEWPPPWEHNVMHTPERYKCLGFMLGNAVDVRLWHYIVVVVLGQIR